MMFPLLPSTYLYMAFYALLMHVYTSMYSGCELDLCVPYLCWLYITADVVKMDTNELPYTPLQSSFADYTNNSWTYDGSWVSADFAAEVA